MISMAGDKMLTYLGVVDLWVPGVIGVPCVVDLGVPSYIPLWGPYGLTLTVFLPNSLRPYP